NENYQDNLYITSSQSAWDYHNQTSYDINQRIVCVHNKDTEDKISITIPRCQFEAKVCDCGAITEGNTVVDGDFKEGDTVVDGDWYNYICAKHTYKNISTNNDKAIISQGTGYCTWGNGIKTDKEYQIPEDRAKILIDQGITPITKDPSDINC